MTHLSWILIVAFSFEAASHASRPLVALQMKGFGSSPAEIGVLFAVANVVPLIVAMPLGRLADHIGANRVLGLGSALSGISFIMMALAPNSLAVAGAQSLSWTGVTAVIVSQQTLMSFVGSAEQRARNYGWLATAQSFGMLLGPSVGGLLADLTDSRLVFLCSALASAVPLLVHRRITPHLRAGAGAADDPGEGRPPASPGQAGAFGALHLLRVPQLRYTCLVAMLNVMAFDVRNSFFPIYLSNTGLSKAQIGLMYSVLGASGTVIRPLTGWLTALMGGWYVLAVAGGIAVPALGLLPLANHWAWIALASAGIGLSFGLTQPLTMSLAASAVAPSERGAALGLRMSAQRLSMVMSPMTLATVAATAGLSAVFAGAATFTLLAAWVALIGQRVTSRPAKRAPAFSA